MLVKIDENGTVQWVKRTWEKGALGALASSVVQSSDGGYVIAGLFEVNSVPNLWIAKLAATPTYLTASVPAFASLIVAAVLESVTIVLLMVAGVGSAVRHRTGGSVARY